MVVMIGLGARFPYPDNVLVADLLF